MPTKSKPYALYGELHNLEIRPISDKPAPTISEVQGLLDRIRIETKPGDTHVPVTVVHKGASHIVDLRDERGAVLQVWPGKTKNRSRSSLISILGNHHVPNDMHNSGEAYTTDDTGGDMILPEGGALPRQLGRRHTHFTLRSERASYQTYSTAAIMDDCSGKLSGGVGAVTHWWGRTADLYYEGLAGKDSQHGFQTVVGFTPQMKLERHKGTGTVLGFWFRGSGNTGIENSIRLGPQHGFRGLQINPIVGGVDNAIHPISVLGARGHSQHTPSITFGYAGNPVGLEDPGQVNIYRTEGWALRVYRDRKKLAFGIRADGVVQLSQMGDVKDPKLGMLSLDGTTLVFYDGSGWATVAFE